ncbi:MAG: hypothetical protein WCC39_12690, partial [Telluria sp.]
MSDSQTAYLSKNLGIPRALAVAGLLIVAITLALVGLLYSSYQSTIEREQTNLRNLAAAYAAQTYYAMLALDTELARGAGGTGTVAPAAVIKHQAARVYARPGDADSAPV